MLKKISVIFLSSGLLFLSPSAHASPIIPKIKTQQLFQAGVYAPGPITPKPITGRQICRITRVVTSMTGFWQVMGKSVPKWVAVPVYGSAVVCTIVYE